MFTEQNRVLYTTAAAQSPGLYPDLPFSAAEGSYTCLPPVAAGKYQVSLDGTDWLLFLPSDLTEGSLNADPAAGKAWTERDGVVSYLDFRTITPDERSGLVLENTVNASYEALKVFGKSEQKAQWNQAEGVTGQAVTVDGQGKNKFDKTKYLEESDFTVEEGYSYAYAAIQLKPNTQYAFSIKRYNGFDGTGQGYLLISSQKGINTADYSSITHRTNPDKNGGPYTTGADGLLYIGYNLGFATNLDYVWANTDVQLEEGAKATEYEDYVHESPSPSYLSALTSNIPAGSYQIPTENGIYEVTLTEDLRGLDDTYRDFIRFDSVSGTGYRENNTQLVRLTRSNMNPYRNSSDVTYRLQGASVLSSAIPKTNSSAPVFCNRLKRYHLTSELIANDIVGISSYTESGMTNNNIYLFLSKSDIGITADDTADTMQAKAYDYLDGNPFYVVVHADKTRVPLTFTKVESSTLPVLSWTAYGSNLFDGVFESGFYTADGEAGSTDYIRCANYIPIQPNTQYYVLKNYSDDTFLWYDADKNYISSVPDLSAPSPANAYYLRFFFYGSDKTTEYMFCSGAKPTVYEPFNSIPPESLIPSPDYPRQIYDLKDVTVTSRGRNLWTTDTEYPIRDILFYDEDTQIYTIKPYTNGTVGISQSIYHLPIPIPAGTEVSVIAEFLYGKITGTISFGGYHYSNAGRYWEGYLDLPRNVDLSGKIIKNTVVSDYEVTDFWAFLYAESSVQKEVKFRIQYQYESKYSRLPLYDKYRCTSATIPFTMRAIETVEENANFSKVVDGEIKHYCCDYIEISDGKVYHNQCVSRVNLPDTAVWSDLGGQKRIILGQATGIKKIGENTLGFFTLGESQKTLNNWANASGYIHPYSGNANLYWYLDYTLLGLDGTETKEVADARLQEWLPTIPDKYIDVIRTSPFRTEITDTWAQELLKLKTAQYYTCLSADKQTGGMRALYPSLTENSSELSLDYLLTSDGENVVTNDGKTVIQF